MVAFLSSSLSSFNNDCGTGVNSFVHSYINTLNFGIFLCLGCFVRSSLGRKKRLKCQTSDVPVFLSSKLDINIYRNIPYDYIQIGKKGDTTS